MNTIEKPDVKLSEWTVELEYGGELDIYDDGYIDISIEDRYASLLSRTSVQELFMILEMASQWMYERKWNVTGEALKSCLEILDENKGSIFTP